MSTEESVPHDPREDGNPADLRELDTLISHLDREVGEYLRMGVSSGLQLTGLELIRVLDMARDLNAGIDVHPVEKTPTDFFMTGLFEEISQIPSNVFEEVVFPDGNTRFMPIRPEVWEAGLQRYKAKLRKALESNSGNVDQPIPQEVFNR